MAASPQTDPGQPLVDRQANDKVTVRAVRPSTALKIDGRVEEEVYASSRAKVGRNIIHTPFSQSITSM